MKKKVMPTLDKNIPRKFVVSPLHDKNHSLVLPTFNRMQFILRKQNIYGAPFYSSADPQQIC
jgi:hypothetical protein